VTGYACEKVSFGHGRVVNPLNPQGTINVFVVKRPSLDKEGKWPFDHQRMIKDNKT